MGWRITKLKYAQPPSAAFDGEGARRRGGRWSEAGNRVAYASSSLALAAMEYFVNLDPRDAPADLVAIQVEIPDHVTTERIAIDKLPDNWKQRPYSTKLQQIGAAWLSGRFSVCLMVPSVVIPQEPNLLINPDHPDFSKLIFQPPSEFTFDPRLWK